MATAQTSVPFNDDPKLREQLMTVIEKYKGEQGALIPVLQQAQEIYGYLPIEVQKIIAGEMGIPLEWAVRAASENPARAIGIFPDYGTLQPGAFGNVILAKEDLTPVMILNKGQRIL